MMTYSDAISYIGACNGTVVKLGLERISDLLSQMGNPQNALRFVHITGTNGKGSVSAFLRSILTESGLRTGSFNSPSLLNLNDTICIDGVPIENADFAEITDYIRGIAEKMPHLPSGFELQTALAFEYFKRKQCDIVVLEAGLGGRLDATNVISENLFSVITGISLDHTAFLGNTTAEIAFEKAGIIKRGSPVILGKADADASAVIQKHAKKLDSQLIRVNFGEISGLRFSLDGTVFSAHGYSGLWLALLGEFQPENALIALRCVDLLRKFGYSIPDSCVFRGLKKASHRGRFELLQKNPTIITDGAHNLDGIRAAARSIRLYFDNKINLVMGVMGDKDFSAMSDEISELAEQVFAAAPDNPRALAADCLAGLFRKNDIPAAAFYSVYDAISAAKSASRKNGLPIVALGSLYMYKDIVDAL
ncbi:MAG: bifunctional folylpolyglutamate synthase/dihydrofolate synthase [Firmicutes bacterium]|nr:bifunctional folylpolyglutamate synthase/dihydrofolate synthase [Bacillota bacterium]